MNLPIAPPGCKVYIHNAEGCKSDPPPVSIFQSQGSSVPEQARVYEILVDAKATEVYAHAIDVEPLYAHSPLEDETQKMETEANLPATIPRDVKVRRPMPQRKSPAAPAQVSAATAVSAEAGMVKRYVAGNDVFVQALADALMSVAPPCVALDALSSQELPGDEDGIGAAFASFAAHKDGMSNVQVAAKILADRINTHGARASSDMGIVRDLLKRIGTRISAALNEPEKTLDYSHRAALEVCAPNYTALENKCGLVMDSFTGLEGAYEAKCARIARQFLIARNRARMKTRGVGDTNAEMSAVLGMLLVARKLGA